MNIRKIIPAMFAAVLAAYALAASEATSGSRVLKAPQKGAAKYALCVGINIYSDASGLSSLEGCANDAKVFGESLVELGGWNADNVTRLYDSAATKAAIRAAIDSVAKTAVEGDTFVYMHSSHGGWYKDTEVFLCAHDDYYWDYELAEDLEAFPAGVKVVVIVDACHSGGLFKGAKGMSAGARSFDLAQRVSSIIDERQAKRSARGEKGIARKLASSSIGWVTAAEYNESSIDRGFYDTAAWLTSPRARGGVPGSTFMGSFMWSWWNGGADTGSDGDGDGHFDAYEGWSVARAFCVNLDDFWGEEDYSFTPQFLNESVLRSVELGECAPLDIARLFPPPANDDFANASVAAGATGSANGSNVYATREEGEPWHYDDGESGSVWWRWTAPNDGEVVFDTNGSELDTVMAVYTGDSLDSLTQVCSNDDAGSSRHWSCCSFTAMSGTNYYVAVAGYSTTGGIVLNWAQLADGEDFLLRAESGSVYGFLGTLPSTLEIPSEINGAAVTSIGYRAFYDCDSLASVSIPAGVTNIGNYAFAYCDNLGTVTFNGGQAGVSIGYRAFWQTPWGTKPLAAPDAGNVVALPDAMTGVNYEEDFGFSGGTPKKDEEEGDYYFAVSVIDGEMPDSINIGGRWSDDASSIYLYGTPGDDEAGDYAFTLRVTDANGSVTQAFTLAVAANPNSAPVIDSSSPAESSLHLQPDEVQTFSVTASDSDGDDLTVSWYVYDDYGDYVSGFDGVSEDSIDFSTSVEGWYYVDVYVSDGNRETSRSWTVRVKETKPLAAPDAGNVVALPGATTGEYYEEVFGFTGGTPIDDAYLDAYVVAGEMPGCMWLGGDSYGNASSIGLYGTPRDDDAGDYAFTIRVTDANGSVDQAFTLTIALNPNSAPVIDSFSPAGSNLRLEVDEVQTFSVTASDPDGDELTYKWYVYDENEEDYVPGFNGVSAESIDFSSSDEGAFTVRVRVSDGKRYVSKSWSVSVVQPRPLVAPDVGGVVALPGATTGVYYWDDFEDDYVRLGFSGGTPMMDVYGDFYFTVEVVDGEMPGSMGIGGCSSSSASRIYLSGTPGDGEAGNYAFSLSVTDANGCVTQAFTLAVAANPNSAPVIDSFSPGETSIRLAPGGVQAFSVTASDPNGDELTYEWYVYDSAEGCIPGWNGKEDGASVEITFPEDIGEYSVAVFVSDGSRNARQYWNVAVTGSAPVNDDFANAVLLEGMQGSTNGTNLGASRESGEPWHDDPDDDTGSVWWRWVAPVDGLVVFDSNGSDFDTVMAVYTGDSLDALTQVCANDDAGSSRSWSRCSFTATAGTTYHIAVAGCSSSGGIVLNWEFPNLREVTFDANGGEGGAVMWLEYGADIVAPEVALTGHTFAGWSPAVPAAATVASNAVYVAQWTVNAYTATFNANGGKGGTVLTLDYGAELVAPAVARTGYILTGWSPAVPPAMPAADTSYVAQWKASTYKVVFNANGGQLPEGKTMAAQVMTYDKAAALRKNAFVRSGCVFIGWAVKKGGAIAYKNAQSVKNLNAKGGTVTLYAVWAKKTYKVAFNANGGTGKMAVEAFAYGKAKSLTANKFTAPKGMVFAGWALKKGGAVVYANGQSVKNLSAKGGTITLYAVWAKPTYKVAFYAYGGTGKTVVQTFKYGKAARLAACKFIAPKGYVFAGWATSKARAKAGVVKFKNRQAVKNLVTNGKTVKLVAVWKKK